MGNKKGFHCLSDVILSPLSEAAKKTNYGRDLTCSPSTNTIALPILQNVVQITFSFSLAILIGQQHFDLRIRAFDFSVSMDLVHTELITYIDALSILMQIIWLIGI